MNRTKSLQQILHQVIEEYTQASILAFGYEYFSKDLTSEGINAKSASLAVVAKIKASSEELDNLLDNYYDKLSILRECTADEVLDDIEHLTNEKILADKPFWLRIIIKIWSKLKY